MKEPSTIKDEVEFWRWREYHRVVPGQEMDKQGHNHRRC